MLDVKPPKSQSCSLRLHPRQEGVLVCKFRHLGPRDYCAVLSTTRKLDMSKLADVRYGPATKGKRSVHQHMQQGRIDLMFHDQKNAQVQCG